MVLVISCNKARIAWAETRTKAESAVGVGVSCSPVLRRLSFVFLLLFDFSSSSPSIFSPFSS